MGTENLNSENGQPTELSLQPETSFLNSTQTPVFQDDIVCVANTLLILGGGERLLAGRRWREREGAIAEVRGTPGGSLAGSLCLALHVPDLQAFGNLFSRLPSHHRHTEITGAHYCIRFWVFWRQFLSSSFGYPETCYTDQAGLKLREIQLPLPLNVSVSPLKTTLIFLKRTDTVTQD